MPVTDVTFRPFPWSLIKFPPDEDPLTLAPPQAEPGIFTPFNIDAKLYNDMLSVYWPITVAAVYAISVSLLNSYNKARNNKPWAVSRTGLFTLFVLAHNIFLTLYSAWTFVGMLYAMRRTFGGILENAGEYGYAPLVDGLCKLSGPRGIGQAATWDPYHNEWSVKDQAVKLLNGKPDPTDVGRLWNEGLGFFGWLFYLSKFYEVIDTLIILAKGKRSSLLQTYHHAGAMMCMWAGIRYMSPPIWMFVQFNSGIHALMYFYYTLAALGVKVPNRIKRSLTTLQISQFIIGANYAFIHLVVGYQLPVNAPYIFSHGIASAVSSAASALPTLAEGGWGPWLKKAVLRAVGDEGLAENVRGHAGARFGIDALKAEISDHNRQEIRYRVEYPEVHCLDTSGQAFAIWLNIFYLLPLTYLFGRFFVTSYLKRAQADKQTALHKRMVRSGSDAAKGVDREIRQAMGDKQGHNSPVDDEFAIELQEEIDRVSEDIKTGAKSVKDEGAWLATRVAEKVKPVVNGAAQKAAEVKKEVKEESKPILNQAQDKAIEVKKEIQEQAPKAAEQVQKKAAETASTVKKEAPKAAEAAKSQATAAQEQVQKQAPKAAEQVKQTANETVTKVKQEAPKVAEQAKAQASEAVNSSQTDGAGDNNAVAAQDSHVRPGESYAEAAKPDSAKSESHSEEHNEQHSEMSESAVEITREEAENLEVNPTETMSTEEMIAERTEGQQPTTDAVEEGSAEATSLFG